MKETYTASQGKLRRLDTPEGSIFYTITRKKVKNLNLRIDAGGQVKLSIPLGLSEERAEVFLREKSSWILRHLKQENRETCHLLPEVTQEEGRRLLEDALFRVYPLVNSYGVAVPELKMRRLKSQWGNCHWAQGYITLNTALTRCPEALRDYVALHELVHFLHHDHGPGFYTRMDELMPDWRQRRKMLKSYAAALC